MRTDHLAATTANPNRSYSPIGSRPGLFVGLANLLPLLFVQIPKTRVIRIDSLNSTIRHWPLFIRSPSPLQSQHTGNNWKPPSLASSEFLFYFSLACFFFPSSRPRRPSLPSARPLANTPPIVVILENKENIFSNNRNPRTPCFGKSLWVMRVGKVG
ncbi:hypothetical protein F4814DRAFT_404609, partial [Daldinia grandis]